MTCSPMVTWPSAAITTLLSRRTHKTVVPCIGGKFLLIDIRRLYRDQRSRPTQGSKLSSGAGFSLWVLTLARPNPRRLKPAPLDVVVPAAGEAYDARARDTNLNFG